MMMRASLWRGGQAALRNSNPAEPDHAHLIEVLDRILDKGLVIDGEDVDEDIVIDTEDTISVLGMRLLGTETEVEVSPLEPTAEWGEAAA
jgi:hypothetical protein